MGLMLFKLREDAEREAAWGDGTVVRLPSGDYVIRYGEQVYLGDDGFRQVAGVDFGRGTD